MSCTHTHSPKIIIIHELYSLLIVNTVLCMSLIHSAQNMSIADNELCSLLINCTPSDHFHSQTEILKLYYVWPLGAVHILCQLISGVFVPPLPPSSAIVSNCLTPPPPLVNKRQHLLDPPSPPRQQSSAFGRPPLYQCIQGNTHFLI